MDAGPADTADPWHPDFDWIEGRSTRTFLKEVWFSYTLRFAVRLDRRAHSGETCQSKAVKSVLPIVPRESLAWRILPSLLSRLLILDRVKSWCAMRACPLIHTCADA